MPEREEQEYLRMLAEDPWADGMEIVPAWTEGTGDDQAFRAAAGVLCAAGRVFGWFHRFQFAVIAGDVGGNVR